jgi:hypothetical protein
MSELIIGLLIFLALSSCNFANPQNGDKIGQVTRVSKDGIFCKTDTVHITGKYGGGELKVTVPENNLELLTKVRHFNDTQEQVKIWYHSDFIKSSCSNHTDNAFLDGIEAHPEGAPK